MYLRPRLDSEDAFTLVEVLLATALVAVIAAMVGFAARMTMSASISKSPTGAARASAIAAASEQSDVVALRTM